MPTNTYDAYQPGLHHYKVNGAAIEVPSSSSLEITASSVYMVNHHAATGSDLGSNRIVQVSDNPITDSVTNQTGVINAKQRYQLLYIEAGQYVRSNGGTNLIPLTLA